MLDEAWVNGAGNDAAWMKTRVGHEELQERKGVVHERLVRVLGPVRHDLQVR